MIERLIDIRARKVAQMSMIERLIDIRARKVAQMSMIERPTSN